MEKGITLIALIITIVILLILAVVTIGSIRESQIIGHAKNASDKYTIAQEKEQIQLALSEWQIQKNAPGNAQSFKNVIETELRDSAIVSGNVNGPLTIIFNKTSNKYKTTYDGAIEEPAKLTGTSLEKYIFGQNLEGRNLLELVDTSTGGLTNKDVTIISTEVEDVDEEGNSLWSAYIKYNNATYKFKSSTDINDTPGKTEAFYGLAKIEVEGENVGKKVSYDGKTWTIVYNDDINGLQMISDEVYNYNGGSFYLGYNDSSITNWDTLKNVVDIDGNGSLNDFERSIYSYNNAITTLNTACENLFKDEDGNYKNSNIVDVRCVGSNPTSKNSENTILYTSENLAKWPDRTPYIYRSGIGNKVGKSTDLNYISDFDRMIVLGNAYIEGNSYWLASRLIEPINRNDRITFNIRSVGSSSIINYSIFYIMESACDYGRNISNSLRPVVKLKSDVQFNGTGTADDPFTIAE